MVNEFYTTFSLINRLLHSMSFGFSWVVLGLLLVIVTMLIPDDMKGGKSLIVVKSVGFTLAMTFLLPGMLAIYLAAIK